MSDKIEITRTMKITYLAAAFCAASIALGLGISGTVALARVHFLTKRVDRLERLLRSIRVVGDEVTIDMPGEKTVRIFIDTNQDFAAELRALKDDVRKVDREITRAP